MTRSRSYSSRFSTPVVTAVTLAGLAGAVIAVAPPAAAATTAVVSAVPAQTIQNFGASGAWWVNDLARFSTAKQQQAADLLFGSGGLQLSAYRYNIGGGGTGVAAGDRAPQSLLVSPGVYDWSHDPGGTTFLKFAAAAGVPDIVGFVNSAPAVWKDNAKSCGGHLSAGSESAYAGYLTDVVTHFAGLGVKINYLSPMNEPTNSFDGSPCSQEGMLVSVAQRDDIVRALGQTLAGRSPGTLISADESTAVSNFTAEVPQWMAQSGTAQYVANLAHHTYDFPTDSALAGVATVGKQFGKPTWGSEICCFTGINAGYGAKYDPTITGALAMTSIIHRDLAVANDSAFHWWTALSKVMGCSPGSSASCATSINSTGYNDGLIYYDPNFATNGNQTLYPTKRYYALGQYSKYVRPGSVRYNVTGAPSGVQILATSQGGNWTLVVNNLNTSAQSVDVQFSTLANLTATAAYRTSSTENLASVGLPPVSATGATSLTLPASSITTYVFHQNAGAVATSLVGVASGKCLDVTNASTANNATVAIYTCNNGSNQKWTPNSAGELRVYGTKCLDALGQATATGSPVGIYDCNGGANQKWTLTAAGTIVGQQSGLCLDVNAAATANSTPVILWTCSGAANQQWRSA